VATLLTSGVARGRESRDDDVDLARDRVLVTRAQAGDRGAFDELYVRYYRRLYRFCVSRLHDSYEAEDVAQEAFARAWRALATFDGERRFYPWLSVIAAHLCTDVHRKRKRSTPVGEFHQANLVSTEDGGEELMLAAVDSELVARAFRRLSDRHQRILQLREGSEWSYQKIADHEGLQTTAVETLLWRARQALKREFASLARAEGRIAALVGSALSLAALRRLLRLPVNKTRQIAEHFGQSGPAIAVGSIAAATAMVIAATVSGPAPQTAGRASAVNGFATAGAPAGISVAPGAVGNAATSGSNTGASEPPVATATSSGEAPAATPTTVGEKEVVPGPSGAAAVAGTPGPGNLGGTIEITRDGPVGGVTSALPSTVDNVAGGASGVLGSLSQAALGAVGAVTSQTPLAGAAGEVGAGLNAAVGTVGSAAGAVPSAAQSASSALGDLLGSTPVSAGSTPSSTAALGTGGSGAGLGGAGLGGAGLGGAGLGGAGLGGLLGG
jgi:RNA polymerase sigma-70 factor (ECF subfamily)